MGWGTGSVFTSRLFWRVLTTHVLLIAVATIALTLTVSRGYRELIETRATHEIETLAHSLEEASRAVLLQERSLSPGDVFDNLGAARGLSFHLYDAQDELVASTNAAEQQQLLPLGPRMLIDRQALQTSQQLRRRDGLNYDLLSRRISLPDGSFGTLQILAGRVALEGQLQRLSRLTWGVTLAVCLFGAILSMVVTARLAQPLEELTAAAQAITSGKLYQTVPITSGDELGVLAETFNTMSRELYTRINELQQQGHQLRENSERLATVLGGMVEGVIAVDSQDRILFANDAAFLMIEFE